MDQPSSTPQPLNQLPPPPLQVSCGRCCLIMTVSPGAAIFRCPRCHLPQMFPPNPNQLSLAAPGFDPLAKMPVICALCLSVFYFPRAVLRAQFKCSLCLIDIAFDISPIKPQFLPSLPIQQKPNKVMEDNGVRNTAAASIPAVKEEFPEKRLVALKDKKRLREIEEGEDCFITDFDPTEAVSLSTLSKHDDDDDNGASDVSITGEKGQVACRDYPHQRHLCVKYPFYETDHDIHCKMCYCYLCDVPAPCDDWTNGPAYFRHCDATATTLLWRLNKKNRCSKNAVEDLSGNLWQI